MGRDGTVKLQARHNFFGVGWWGSGGGRAGDIYGNDYITSLVSHTDSCLAHMAN